MLEQVLRQKIHIIGIVSAHNTPPNWSGGMDAPQWSTAEILNNEPWMNYNQTQVGMDVWQTK
jgi:hypothetical protein